MILSAPENWWDGRDSTSFFPAVYRQGDDSVEGYLNGELLNVQQRTRRECDLVESLLELPRGARILDCPCGYGRISIELARRSYEVTGVDLCPTFIEEANQEAKRFAVDSRCRFLQGDMRALPEALGAYDACISMFFSFGFFFDDDENLKTLREYARVIRPGGTLLLHTDVNPDRVISGTYGDRNVRTLRGGGFLSIEEKYDPPTRRLNGQWIIEAPSGNTARSYSVRIYSHEEMASLLHAAGFSDTRIVYPRKSETTDKTFPQEVVYVATK